MHEAVGVFKTMGQLQGAVKELERTEFPRDAISVLGSHKSLGSEFENFGAEIFDDSNLEAPVHSEEKTIGASVLVGGTAYLGAMAAALAAGAVTVPAFIAVAALGGVGGAAAGGILAKVLDDHFDHEIESQIDNGGLLLWVRTPDEHKEELASKILRDYGADNVRIHEH